MKINRGKYYIEFDDETIQRITNEFYNMNRTDLMIETTVRQYLIRNIPYNNDEHKQQVLNAIDRSTIKFEVDYSYAYVYMNKDKYVIPMKSIWADLPVFKAIDGEITGFNIETN